MNEESKSTGTIYGRIENKTLALITIRTFHIQLRPPHHLIVDNLDDVVLESLEVIGCHAVPLQYAPALWTLAPGPHQRHGHAPSLILPLPPAETGRHS